MNARLRTQTVTFCFVEGGNQKNNSPRRSFLLLLLLLCFSCLGAVKIDENGGESKVGERVLCGFGSVLVLVNFFFSATVSLGHGSFLVLVHLPSVSTE